MKRLRKFLALLVGLEAFQVWSIALYYERDWLRAYALSEIEKPYVLRVLLPLLARTFSYISGDALFWLGVLFVGSAVGFYFSMCYFSDYFYRREYLPFAACQVLFLLTFFWIKPYDYATAMFFALCLGLLARRKLGVYLVVFALATLNRETTFLLTVFCAVWFWRKVSVIRWCLFLLAQVTIYVVIKIGIDRVFMSSQGNAVWFGKTFSAYFEHWYVFLPLLLLVFVRFDAPDFVRTFLVVVVPVQIILHLLFGMPFEFRVFAESVPVITMSLSIRFSGQRYSNLTKMRSW